jgi:hypothetical protein
MKAVALPIRKATAVIHGRGRLCPSIGTTQDATDQAADQRNAIARASVAITIPVARASIAVAAIPGIASVAAIASSAAVAARISASDMTTACVATCCAMATA